MDVNSSSDMSGVFIAKKMGNALAEYYDLRTKGLEFNSLTARAKECSMHFMSIVPFQYYTLPRCNV